MAALKVTSISLNHGSNKKSHYTNYFRSNELIVRRGQSFLISLTCNRAMQSKERIVFTAATGPKPSEQANTKLVFTLDGSSNSSWSAALQSTNGSTLNVLISSSARAAIGHYKLTAQIVSNGANYAITVGNFTLLFNPWCSGDDVYLANGAERSEYVLNDTGIIYQGTAKSIGSRRWDYGQFESGILNICLALLDRNIYYRRDPGSDVARRNDVVYVSRVLSAMVNSNNDNGVLLGKWKGNFSDGVAPSNWNGSVTILKRWYNSGPVKYGQCWVFAGVLCTALRALGIPTRTVTNFESAHDTNRNLSIDQYVDTRGRTIDGGDSVWNFHVWNECWFIRRDLGAYFNGWQVLDATPQEPSGGVFCLGPTSVVAVREGYLDRRYDVAFVFAEVNGDRTKWIRYNNGSRKKVYYSKSSIGQRTSTKAVGSQGRVEITNSYKYPEGSPKEREIYYNALKRLSGGNTGFKPMSSSSADGCASETVRKPEISGTLDTTGDLEVGKDITMTLSLKNEASINAVLEINTNASSIMYTGASENEILNESRSISLEPNEEKAIPIRIPYSQYEKSMTDGNMIKVSTVCEDNKEGRLLIERSFVLNNPPIIIELKGEAKVGKPVTVDVIFANPLNEEVSDCELVVEGSGLVEDQLITKVPSLKPKQNSKFQVEITPYRSGTKQLVVDFSSDKIKNAKGYLIIDVEGDESEEQQEP
ncbi:protein-glutamine gamma-glutamyltransferase E [Microcaecilia unicolor]|uniref:protein-glutamine gamma-glutamyltransferase n=1 Tax=Microcaecilia unicolor TaxID=1415580 RepID=A0A6P7Z0T0_9AMPH|nr:protein-glutamine gamma-glutamyltransferase E-like [Microcaecilia unicolor]